MAQRSIKFDKKDDKRNWLVLALPIMAFLAIFGALLAVGIGNLHPAAAFDYSSPASSVWNAGPVPEFISPSMHLVYGPAWAGNPITANIDSPQDAELYNDLLFVPPMMDWMVLGGVPLDYSALLPDLQDGQGQATADGSGKTMCWHLPTPRRHTVTNNAPLHWQGHHLLQQRHHILPLFNNIWVPCYRQPRMIFQYCVCVSRASSLGVGAYLITYLYPTCRSTLN